MQRVLSLALAAALLGCAGRDPAAPSAPVAAEADPAAPGPGVGQPAPPISTTAIDGAPLALVRGKVTIVAFWATWSHPDKIALIKLQEIYALHGPAKLAVIALSIDDEATQLAEFAKTYGLRFPIAWDAGHRLALTYRPRTDPTIYVLDRAGIIRFVHSGYHDGEDREIASEVASLTAAR